MSQKIYNPNNFSTRTVNDPYNLTPYVQKPPLSYHEPYNTPKIVELDANNNVILPDPSLKSIKRNKKNNEYVFQQNPPFNINNSTIPQQQNFNPLVQQQVFQNPSQQKTFIIEDEHGNELSRIISSQQPVQQQNTVVLKPSAVQPTYILSAPVAPIAPVIIQPILDQKSAATLKSITNGTSKGNKRHKSQRSLERIDEETKDSSRTILVGRFERKKSDYIFCCYFCGKSNTDTCQWCWKWCGCPTWFAILLSIVYVLILAGLVAVLVLAKLGQI